MKNSHKPPVSMPKLVHKIRKPHIKRECGGWMCVGRFKLGGSKVESFGWTPEGAYSSAYKFADKLDRDIAAGLYPYLG